MIEEVADVDTTQWVHLREGEDTRESKFVAGLFRRVPAHGDDLIVLLMAVDGHGHVVVCLDNFEEVVAEALFQELRILGEECEEEIIHR